MTIRQRLLLSILLLIVAFVVIAGTIAYIFRSVNREAAHIAAVNHTVRMVFELSLLGYEYQTHHEERAAMQWRGIHRRLGQNVETMLADVVVPEEHAVLRRMHDNCTLLGTLFESLAAHETRTEATRLVGESLLLRSNVMVADAHQLTVSSSQALTHLPLLLLGSLAPLTVACIFVFLANRRILRSLAALHTGAAAIGTGQLTHTLRVVGQDEFAVLAGTLNAMTTQLHTQITQLTHAQAQQQHYTQELARSNADLAQFAYVASHDLQEPLRMVASYMGLLARRYQGQLDARADKYIAYAVDGATRMQALIHDLLAYSRVGTQGKPLAPTDCTVIVQQVIDNLQQAIAERGALVTHDALPTVRGDAIQLMQIFQNLIGNAIKFCQATPPRVHIWAEHQDKAWRLSVQDNGIGIAPEHTARIFLLFQRLHTRAAYPGTGMGLAICQKIVERHGGRIWVESQPGQGSVFHFTIPYEEPHNHEAEPARQTC